MGLSKPAAGYRCPNESSLFEEKDLINFRSEDYLTVQHVQLGLNAFSVVGFLTLFISRGFFPEKVNINAKVLLTLFLATSLMYSLTALTYKIHYSLMSLLAECIGPWVLPFYTNGHRIYVVVSNSPFWFLIALVFERLAATIGWRNYENADPVLSIFLTMFAIYGTAIHTIFPYFGKGVMRMSIDLTNAYGVQEATTITNFFITAMLFYGTIGVLVLYCFNRRKLSQLAQFAVEILFSYKSKLMSPYQLLENIEVTCLLLKISLLYLIINLVADFYLDYIDQAHFSSFLRQNNFDFMVIYRCLLPLQLLILYGAMKNTSDRHSFA